MTVNLQRLNPHVSVDCVIFGFDGQRLQVLLIERNADSKFALPGDLIQENEDLDEAAYRILKELTGLRDIYLEQFRTFGGPNRIRQSEDVEWLRQVRAEPNARVITVAYFSLIRIEDVDLVASSFAKSAQWHEVPVQIELAFDHNIILDIALESLGNKLEHETVGFNLLPQKFTLSQLQKLHEAVLGIELDKRNFRKKYLAKDLLDALDEHELGVAHKPARLYKLKD
jgi:8-oxo-dGTP diphosphatase